MKAIQIKQYGDTGVLEYAQVNAPQPQAGQALVRLKAAGLNFIDIYMRTGRYAPSLPFIPGCEAAGVVEQVGSDVTEVKVGDRVAFVAGMGGYAEYTVVDAKSLIPLPDNISFEQGAAFPLQGMTAHYLLHEYYQIKSGDAILVQAAAGGMGLLLVQWLKHMKAKVIGTVSTPEKAKIAKEAGADHIILYTQQDFVEETMKLTDGKGAAYIIDGVGKTTFTKDMDAVRQNGWITIFGAASGVADPVVPNALMSRGITISGGSLFNHMNNREELLRRANAALKGISEGWLKLRIDQVFSLDQAGKAQALLEGRQTTGKIVLKID